MQQNLLTPDQHAAPPPSMLHCFSNHPPGQSPLQKGAVPYHWHVSPTTGLANSSKEPMQTKTAKVSSIMMELYLVLKMIVSRLRTDPKRKSVKEHYCTWHMQLFFYTSAEWQICSTELWNHTASRHALGRADTHPRSSGEACASCFHGGCFPGSAENALELISMEAPHPSVCLNSTYCLSGS